MGDVMVFKVQSLTEGGYVAFAGNNYSQFCETLDLAAKRLSVKVDEWAKETLAAIKAEARDELGQRSTPATPTPVGVGGKK